jgi:hypothetical protein
MRNRVALERLPADNPLRRVDEGILQLALLLLCNER